MQSALSLSLLQGSLWTKMFVSDRVQSIDQIELFNNLTAHFDI